MAKNAFSKFKGFVSKPKRNVFDLSFQNNMTGGFGALYPVFCKEVIPGDSFRIKPTMGFRTMPMYFPVQTQMRADLHFFYVRNRNLWSDWTDFICGNKSDLVAPYLSPTLSEDEDEDDADSTTTYSEFYGTGSLSDYLGLPSTFGGSAGTSDVAYPYVLGTVTDPVLITSEEGTIPFVLHAPDGATGSYAFTSTNQNQSTWKGVYMTSVATGVAEAGSYTGVGFYLGDTATSGISTMLKQTKTFYTSLGAADFTVYANEYPSSSSSAYDNAMIIAYDHNTSGWPIIAVAYGTYAWGSTSDSAVPSYTITLGDSLSDFNEAVADYSGTGYRLFIAFQYGSSTYTPFNWVGTGEDGARYPIYVNYTAEENYVAEADVTGRRAYYSNLSEDGIKINALPYRAYESIYNAFYRNQQNDPFTLNDVPEYNKWIPSSDGGADSNLYGLHYRNWENDFLTTAVQSPQQGNAPLVGVSASGTFTFQDSEGNEYTAKAVVGDDGLLTGIESYDTGLPSGSLRNLIDAISYGININDFRNVNALQRWLETNIRRGYRYKEQLLSHFGVDASFEELDMPEFIGGMSQNVNVSTTYQTSEGSADPLGSYAGNATVFGQSNHYIEKYCDEHGFIIGILSFVPTPVYSQLLNKQFLKNSPLDYFFPEFGHIGMQPITYGEVCPIQKYADLYNGDGVTDGWQYDTFGYQRAWYEYVGSVDEVHGEFRTTLRDFLCNRTFNDIPELGPDFLHIDPEQVNDIFSVTDTSDKFLGLLNFEVVAKRPIPMFGIPRLE